MASLNFEHLSRFDAQFDTIGELAERLLDEHPQVSIVLCRQLAELFATGTLELKGIDIPEHNANGNRANLFDYINLIRDERPFQGRQWLVDTLHLIRDRANRTTHVRFRQEPMYHRDREQAAPLLERCHQVGVWFQNRFGPRSHLAAFQVPLVEGGVLQSQGAQENSISLFSRLESELLEVELAVDVGRQENEESLDAWLQRFKPHRQKGALSQWQENYLLLTLDSIRLAKQSHAGAQPDTLELTEDQVARMAYLRTGDWPSSRNPVLLFLNRWAIWQTNGYRFEQAYEQVERLIQEQRKVIKAWEQQDGESAPGFRDPELGKLLGTFGQLTAFWGWVGEEPGFLQEAAMVFEEARLHFSAPHLQARQDTYWAQAFVEQKRWIPDFVADADADAKWEGIQARLDADLAHVLQHPFSLEPEHFPSIFGVALLLKHYYVAGQQVPFLEQFAQELAAVATVELGLNGTWAPPHPYEQVLGLLKMVVPGGFPGVLSTAMDNMAAQDSISGFIATIYRYQWAFRAGDFGAEDVERIVEMTRNKKGWPQGWVQYADRLRGSCAPGGAGPWAVLPFNFA